MREDIQIEMRMTQVIENIQFYLPLAKHDFVFSVCMKGGSNAEFAYCGYKDLALPDPLTQSPIYL